MTLSDSMLRMIKWSNGLYKVVSFVGASDSIKDGKEISISQWGRPDRETITIRVEHVYKIHRGFGEWAGFAAVFAITDLGDTAIWVRPC
jgi:hypothetical protein